MANKKQYSKLDDIGILGSQEKKGAGSAYHRKKTGEAFRKARAAATPPSSRRKKAS